MSLTLALRREAATPWQVHLATLAAVSLAILTLFHADAAHIVAIWWNDSTFNHCFLVPLLVGWLVWQRWPELRRIEPTAWPPGLALIALGGFGWLLGEAGSLALARHVGLAFMLQGAVVACLGPRVARGLAFPLFYALFMIPLGEEFVPLMQTITAEMATALLGIAGIPAHLEGVFITTPAGYFEVAEACAGVKFLIAMVAFGALVANVCFRSWHRRAAFMAVSIIIPVLANGVRAWGTIFIADRTSVDFAVGFDHVIYGGIFFAIVIALILAAGWSFFDRPVDSLWLDSGPRAAPRGASPAVIGGASIALVCLPLAWSAVVSAAGTQPVSSGFALPQIRGWQLEPAAGEWRPSFDGAGLFRLGRYRDGEGRAVDLAIAVYPRQSEGHELVGYGQGAAGPDSGWAWTADGVAPPGGRSERIASHGVVREVVSFYRVGSITTGSAMGVKLETMKVRLLGGPQRAGALLVSAQAPAAGVAPRTVIDDFLDALGPIEPLIDQASGADL